MSSGRPKEEWDVLSADAFIKALHGDTVLNGRGEDVSFLQNQRVTINNVIVDEEVYMREGIVYKNAISIANAQFISGFIIHGGCFESSFTFSRGYFQSGIKIYGGKFLIPMLFRGTIHVSFCNNGCHI
ncbi:MAG: hypothetical protein RJQ09_12060 [Cyclobacteriaceae bacterium]